LKAAISGQYVLTKNLGDLFAIETLPLINVRPRTFKNNVIIIDKRKFFIALS